MARAFRVSAALSACVVAVFLVRDLSGSAMATWQAVRHFRSYTSQLTTPDFDQRPFLNAVRRLEPSIRASGVVLIITSAPTKCYTCGEALATWTAFARRNALTIASVDVSTDIYSRPDQTLLVSRKDLFAVSSGVSVTPTGVVINDAGRVTCIMRGAPTAVDLHPCEMSMRGTGLFIRDVGHWNGIL